MVLKNGWGQRGSVATALGLGAMLAPQLLTPNLALAQNYPSPVAVITSPVAGTSVSSPVTVAFTLGAPGGSGPMKGQHHHGGQAYLVVDEPAPPAGASITADAVHIAFPAGQHQLSVSLKAGQHQLQVVFANHEGLVASRLQPSAAVTVTVQ